MVGALKTFLTRRVLGDQLAGRLLGPGLAALVIKVASAAFSYLMLVAFARMLDPAAYGHFGVMLNISIVLSAVAALGLPTAAMRFWAGHQAKGEIELARGFHIGAQKLLLTIAAVFCSVGVIISSSGWGSAYFGVRYGALLVAVFAVVLAFADYFANILRAQNKIIWSMVPRDVIWRIGSPIVAFILFWSTGFLTAGWAIGCCIAVLAVLTLAQGLTSHQAMNTATADVSVRSDWSQWRGPLLPLAGASILFAMVQQLDVVVVSAFLGAQEAGAYFAAQKTASLLGLVMIAGGLVAAPLMSAAWQSGRKAELQRLCKMLALAIAVSTAIGFVVLFAIGKPLLSIFDPAYQSAYPLLLILGLGYAIDALAGPTAYLMQMTSLEGAYLRIMAIVYAFVLALQLVFVPLYGAVAAACATALGVALWNIIAITQLRRTIGVDSSILSFFLPPKSA
jgi:O-antigen/teichoic acid export membrane protein